MNKPLDLIEYNGFFKIYFKSLNGPATKIPGSLDALCKLNEDWCFIEFKNGRIRVSEKKGISEKIGHSLLVLMDNKNSTLEEIREQAIFILVYNEEAQQALPASDSRTYIQRHMFERTNTKFIKFNLGRFENIYFKKVFTLNMDEFNDLLISNSISLPHSNEDMTLLP